MILILRRPWILRKGKWNDDGKWDNKQTWNDL